jgi:hypothetical protein
MDTSLTRKGNASAAASADDVQLTSLPDAFTSGDIGHSLRKRTYDFIRLVESILLIAVIDENRSAPRSTTRLNIAPSVADNVTRFRVDTMLGRSLPDHSRLRLAAIAVVSVDVEACLDVIDRHASTNFGVHGVDRRFRGEPSTHIGLIGDDNDGKAQRLELADGISDAGENVKFAKGRRSDQLTGSLNVGVDHTVAIEKNGSFHDSLCWNKNMSLKHPRENFSRNTEGMRC